MRAGATVTSGARHVVGVGLQALIISAILATVALAMSAFYKPAGFVAGVDDADAGGRIRATIGWASSTARTSATSGGSANFAVTRSVADNDPVMWVTNKCYDGRDRLVSWVDLPVRWGTTASLTGEAGPFDSSGAWCKAYATLRPYQSRVLGDAVMTYDVAS
jgi:hypothetical protein